MGKRVIHICDICSKESVENPNFESENIRGKAELVIKGYTGAKRSDGTFSNIDFNQRYPLICWECSDKIRHLIDKLSKAI